MKKKKQKNFVISVGAVAKTVDSRIPGASDVPVILFQDKNFLVIDKPAGLAVHPGRAGNPSVEDYFTLWRHGKTGPWLAHRLDQDTAGCLLIALRKPALLAAQKLFAKRRVEKLYWALVRGVPAAVDGVIDMPLAKITNGRAWKMAPVASAPPAMTRWTLRGHDAVDSWLELRPQTGRTHQIRAHCEAIGHPICGDAIYGGGDGRLCLLARAISLPLDPPLKAQAPVPAHMRGALEACGYAQ